MSWGLALRNFQWFCYNLYIQGCIPIVKVFRYHSTPFTMQISFSFDKNSFIMSNNNVVWCCYLFLNLKLLNLFFFNVLIISHLVFFCFFRSSLESILLWCTENANHPGCPCSVDQCSDHPSLWMGKLSAPGWS